MLHLVHEGLREAGLVDLVVPVLAVADEVDDDVAVPALAPLGRQLVCARHRLHVVAVHVQDGRVQRLGYVRAVRRRAALARVRREGHLRTMTLCVKPPLPFMGMLLARLVRWDCKRERGATWSFTIIWMKRPTV